MTKYKYYDLLGVEQSASKEELKKAYKKLAIQHHPDKGGDPELFKEISHAYSVLADDDQRRRYDQLGDENYQSGGDNGFAGVDPQSIFEQFFGGGGMPFPFDISGFGGFHGFDPRQSQQRMKRKDHVHALRITLAEAYTGIKKTMRITMQRQCKQCREQCYACQGRGQVTDMRRMGFLTQMMTRACDVCKASGFTSKPNSGCKECEGKGATVTEKKIEIQLDAGVQNGHRIVFEGMGDQAATDNEISGDLIFEVQVQQDPNFVRQGNDLLCTIQISLWDSITGKDIQIPHFAGPIQLNTSDFGVVQPNKPYVLPGKGMPRGNLILIFQIEYPSQKLSTEHKNRLREVFKFMT